MNNNNKTYVDFESVINAAQARIPELVKNWLPDGKQEGPEWVTLNPTRPDKTDGSFKVNLDTGKWSDFSTKDKGSNVASLYVYLHKDREYRDNMIALCDELGINGSSNTLKIPTTTKKPTKKPKRVYPTPLKKVWINPTIGEITPSKTYHYQDAQGHDVLIVYRCDKSDKLPKKEFRQLSRVNNGWSWQGLNKNPLYRLPEINSNPDKPLIFCEGEKPANAAQQSIFKDNATVTTTAGGSQSPQKTDFSPVKGRNVGIWPDNDNIGKGYADTVARLALEAGAKSARILPIPENWGEKWDAADVAQLDIIPDIVFNFAEWPQVELQQLVENNSNIKWPDKFIKNNGSLLFDTGRLDKQNKPIYKLTYHGFFQPTALHINADTGDTWVAIEFDCESRTKTVTAKQSDLATKSAIIKTLTSKGAFITESNAALCCDFISSFLSLNRGNLLKKRFTERLGLHDGDVFVLPNKTIGDDNLQYNGDLPNDQPQDDEIYANAVKTIFNDWGDDAWPSLLALGYSFSSPFIQKLGIKRNPIIALTGRSGYGKSTLIRFALSAWGDGTQKPFTIEGSVRTTPTGFYQNIAGLNGLPCFFDEINLADQHRGNAIKWRDAAIAFANGQARLIGSKDNELKGKGGNRIKGVLFGAGESLPDLKVEGVFNRQLVIDVTANPPFGAVGRVGIKQNPIGHQRAQLLEDATDYGSGVLGGNFIKYVLSNWEKFESDYRNKRNEWGRAFNEHTDGVCLCVVVLNHLADLLGINNRQTIQTLIDNISQFFVSYQNQENHPAIVAIEELSALIVSSEQATKYVGGETGIIDLPYYKLGNQPFFWLDGDHYIIPAKSEVLQRLGDLKSFYSKWREIGFVVPDSKGNATQNKRSKIGTGQARCLVIPKSFFEGDDNNDVTPVTPTNKLVQQENLNNNNNVTPVTLVTPHNTISRCEKNFDGCLPNTQTDIQTKTILGVTSVTSATRLNIKDKIGVTENLTGVTGVTKDDSPPDLPPQPPIEFYEDISKPTTVINKPNSFDKNEHPNCYDGFGDWVDDVVDSQSTNQTQPEIEFRPNKKVIKNLTLALEKMGSDNVFQIAKQAGGGCYTSSLVQEHLDFMDNVKSEQNADGEPIYSLVNNPKD